MALTKDDLNEIGKLIDGAVRPIREELDSLRGRAGRAEEGGPNPNDLLRALLGSMISGRPGMPGVPPGMLGMSPGMPGVPPGMLGMSPGMPGVPPGMPGVPLWMPPVGLWTILWAWWLSWFIWPMALPLAGTGQFPLTSRFAATRAEFWLHWFHAMARIAQQIANTNPFASNAGHYPGPYFPFQFSTIDGELVKTLEKALNEGPLNSLSPEQKMELLWIVRFWLIMTRALPR